MPTLTGVTAFAHDYQKGREIMRNSQCRLNRIVSPFRVYRHRSSSLFLFLLLFLLLFLFFFSQVRIASASLIGKAPLQYRVLRSAVQITGRSSNFFRHSLTARQTFCLPSIKLRPPLVLLVFLFSFLLHVDNTSVCATPTCSATLAQSFESLHLTFLLPTGESFL